MFLYINVPLFHIYKEATGILKLVNTVNQLADLASCAFSKACFWGGTDGTIDNEAPNIMISFNFSCSSVSGTGGNKARFSGTKHPKMLDKAMILWHNVIVTLEHCHTTTKERNHKMPTIENYGSISHQPITIDGVTRTLREWADYHRIPYKTIAMRWKRGHREPKRLFFKAGHTQDATGVWVFNDKPSKA